jgi:ParB family chromosome partitioning protein
MTDRKPERPRLGRGLSALMADVSVASEPGLDASMRRDVLRVPVESIRPNPDQPRRTFPEDAMTELANSIRERGVIQPLIVRELPEGSGSYEIVAGERRWRAAQMAQVHDLPVLVRNFTDAEAIEVAIIENIQRADLNPVEEAAAFRQLMERFGHTQERLAEALGKSRSHIANALRLLSLPDEVQEHLREGRLTAGHARALVPLPNAAEVARTVIARGLSVRQTEDLARRPPKTGQAARRRAEKDADTRALESDLSANLGMAVTIDHRAGEPGGTLTIRYPSLEALDSLCRMLSAGSDVVE